MSENDLSDAQLATVSLRDDEAELVATFVPGANMLCCSLRHRGEELLAQNDGVSAYSERGKTMGIPLLYPWANRLAAFHYEVAGRSVEVPHDPARIALDDNGLPIHGVIGGRLEWELTNPSDGGTRSLKAELSWSESAPQLFELFPFRHDLLYEARLIDGRLEIEVTVHACGEDFVPVVFGFHPYLSPGGRRQDWSIELAPMRHLALDRNQIPVGSDPHAPGGASPAQRFELGEREFDDGFDSVANPARFGVKSNRRGIELEFLHGYPCAQVYAPLSGHFICFEPMTSPTNALRSGDGLLLLSPGESYRTGFSLRVLPDTADTAGAAGAAGAAGESRTVTM